MTKSFRLTSLTAVIALILSATLFVGCKDNNEPVKSIAGLYNPTWMTMSVPTESGETISFNIFDFSTISDEDLAKLGVTREELQQQMGGIAGMFANYQLYLGEDNSFWMGMGEEQAQAKGTYEFNNKTLDVIFNGTNEEWPNNASYDAKTKKVTILGDGTIAARYEFTLKE
jgi:hypothetical protein